MTRWLPLHDFPCLYLWSMDKMKDKEIGEFDGVER